MKKKNLECLYRKVSGRYVPVRVCYEPSSLDDGIWYVKHHNGGVDVTNADYIGELLKIGDAEDISLSTQCGLDKIATEIMCSDTFNEFVAKGYSFDELIHFIVKMCYDRSDK